VCAVLLISLDSCVPPKLPAVISRDFQTSSLEIFQRSPLRCLLLHESSPSSSIRRLIRLRPDVAKHRTPSALVVPPDSDGLLLTEPCRFVAPCFQPWGSSRFLPRLPLPVLQPSAVLVAFPNSPLIPSEAFPLSTAALRHRNRCHPRCSTGAFHARLPHRSASRSRFPLATRFRSPMLPPVCFSQSPHRQPRGFSPSISPLPRVRVATHPRPDAPLGFVPL